MKRPSGSTRRICASKLFHCCAPSKSSNTANPPFCSQARNDSASVSVRIQKPGSHMKAIGYLNSSGSSSISTRLMSVRCGRPGRSNCAAAAAVAEIRRATTRSARLYDPRLRLAAIPMALIGLHHVTATVDDAQDDLDFCLGGLGLRLVKKTVNFDNHSVYHFYYGDQLGTPGTIWTTFPYKDRGVPAGSTGAGQVTVTSLSVPAGSLEFWRQHLSASSIAATDLPERFGEPVVRFSDRSGLTFELIATGGDDRTPWVADGFDPASAVRGLHSVTMVVREA